ncbi:uncharacterized protein Tco025E_00067 [Trypanosoma conorhini]|uniref:Uncharacterized protein n=1 Tax=Trypanosoma conorhini TaxID=83891 RepID=A0A422QCH6_9TRYP|nr:uncharacterized protein Tco025E_00067 [Trypanosoma conorhini]RNF27683.1 hypothetical protein Tco025E_00067 [Trypanosoma conorhini]
MSLHTYTTQGASGLVVQLISASFTCVGVSANRGMRKGSRRRCAITGESNFSQTTPRTQFASGSHEDSNAFNFPRWSRRGLFHRRSGTPNLAAMRNCCSTLPSSPRKVRYSCQTGSSINCTASGCCPARRGVGCAVLVLASM